MKKITDFLQSKNALIITLFLLQFNLVQMYAQSYFAISTYKSEMDISLFIAFKFVISIIVALAFASITINVIIKSKNQNDGLLFAFFDFVVYCSYYGNNISKWYSAGLYGNICQALFFAIITSVAVFKLSELFLADIEQTTQEQKQIADLSNQVQNLLEVSKSQINQIEKLSYQTVLDADKITTLSKQINDLSEIVCDYENKNKLLSEKESMLLLELSNTKNELCSYGSEETLETLRETLRGTKSSYTTNLNKGKDVSKILEKIKILETKINKKENANGNNL
jgi:hypothetical protein